MSDEFADGGRPWITPEEARSAIAAGDGRGVRVAVIDSGVEANHPLLRKMRLGDSIGLTEEDGRIVTRHGEGRLEVRRVSKPLAAQLDPVLTRQEPLVA